MTSTSWVQVTFHGLETSEALDALITEKAEKLRVVCDRLQKVRVVVDQPHRSHSKGNELELKIELLVPGDEIVVRRTVAVNDGPSDVYALVKDAFHAAQRVLTDHMAKQSSRVRG